MAGSRIWIAAALAALLGACAPAARPPVGAPSVAGSAALPAPPGEGVYTVAQAERGEEVFNGVCSACHGKNEFTGRMFERTWMAEPIGYLYQHISTAMPQDNPGSLAPEQYAAVVAYLLQLNGHPPGDRELPADVEALRELRW